MSYTLSPESLPHRIARSSAIIVATAPSIFSVDFSLSAFDVSGRIGSNKNVIHHPPKDRMAAVRNFSSNVSFMSSFVGGDISLKPCPKGITEKPRFSNSVSSGPRPSDQGNLADVVLRAQLFNERFNEAVMHHIPFGG